MIVSSGSVALNPFVVTALEKSWSRWIIFDFFFGF